MTIIQAWELAATASGSPALRRTVLGWRPQVDGGQTPAEVVSASGRFPELFAAQYATGEISGQLDDTLGRLHGYYQEEGSRKLHAFSRWTPRAIYFCIVLMIAYQIIHFYTGYFNRCGTRGDCKSEGRNPKDRREPTHSNLAGRAQMHSFMR